jgi:tRNA(Ile)-lysidine synthase
VGDLGVEAFGRRLRPDIDAPLAVGFSGGGDSLAALLATKAWSDRCGRRLVVLSVDHGLQPQSAAWTAFAAETAGRLGLAFHALAWTGDKPAHGLPAAARAARHRLLAQAARRAGARVVVLGHTADDLLEGEVMRSWGSSLGAPREWSPSPVWPEGRGIFLLRPLLGLRRAALRAWLAERGEAWIDDPANLDLAQTRSRARELLAGGGQAPESAPDDADLAALSERVDALAGGALSLDRQALRAAPSGPARRWLAAAALSAGGGARPPRAARLAALAERLAGPGPVRATLCGARIVAREADVLIVRDAGEAARGGLAPLDLPADGPMVWDGRFELTAARPGLSVRRLGGLAVRLAPAERAALRRLVPEIRPALPAAVDAEGRVSCPILADGAVRALDLVAARLAAACGAISKEPAT